MISNILRTALGDLLRAIADKIAMILEVIPDWEELGDLPAFYDLSGTNSEYESDGSTSRSDFDCTDPPFGCAPVPGSGSGSSFGTGSGSG
jgi:hypothetical protein